MTRFAGLRPMKVAGAKVAEPTPEGAPVPAWRRTQPLAPPGEALSTLIAARPTDAGPLHLKQLRVGPWRAVQPVTLQALSLDAVALDLSRPLFLDTETTGLAGGTGTLAFLVGAAVVVEGEVMVEQAHVAGPGQERPVLEWLRARLLASTALFTFNGKSFDWPLLRSRYVMNRLAPPPELPHIDLLHCARRVFRYELEQATLTALELHALDVRRVGDLAGALIPAVWFDYLRTGRVAGLGRVLEHNERDVRSMVELLYCLSDAWEGLAPLPEGRRLALALLAHRNKDHARAYALVDALEGAPGRIAAVALELKAALLRQRGDVTGAVAALERSLPLTPTSASARVRLKLAKLYEHQLKDVQAALAHAPHARDAEPADSHQRRLARLKLKG
jgi:uncharacterized protein YprB with RNaseH-like and TPR domain